MSTLLDNRYELIERIGDGGMAEVYRAKDTMLDRFVAIKILHPQFTNDEAFVTRFRREAQGAARLSHPNIVNIYDVGCCNGKYYIVMEYVNGETLKDKILREGALPIDTTLRIVQEIAEALENAHANNLVHCDIKPHNILINSAGHVKVADFGIARATSSATITFTGSVVGSVHYFSPEQARGTTVSPKSDVYSLGVVMYEMLTGQVPFTGETAVSIAIKQIQDTPVLPHELRPGIPPIVEAIVMKALAKDSSQRFTSEELIAEIKQARRMLSQGELGEPAYVSADTDPFATRIMTPEERRQIDEAVPNQVQISGGGPQISASPADKEMPAKNRSGFFSKKFILALLVIIVAGFGIGAFFAYGNFWSGKTVEVPNVVGLTQSQAEETLKAENLRVEIAEAYDDKVPAGKVASQTPEPGRVVKENRLITIYISKGGEQLTMPNLVGMLEKDVTNQLQQMGININQVYRQASDKPAGTILQQSIMPNSQVTKGSGIDLVISKGPDVKKAKVPKVIGLPVEQAVQILQAEGFNVSTSSQSGIVSAQSVEAGDEVPVTTTIALAVSDSGSSMNTRSNEESNSSGESAKPKKSSDSNSNKVVKVPQRQHD